MTVAENKMASESSHLGGDVRVEYIRSRRPPSSLNATPIRVAPNADDNDLDSDNGSYVLFSLSKIHMNRILIFHLNLNTFCSKSSLLRR